LGFIEFFKKKYEKLDILINNAAQTIRKPPVFYQHLLDIESTPNNKFEVNIQNILPNDYHMKEESLSIEYKNDIFNEEKYKDISFSALVTQIPLTEEDKKKGL